LNLGTGIEECGNCVEHSDCQAFLDTPVCAAAKVNATVDVIGECIGGCLNHAYCIDKEAPWCDMDENVCVQCLVSGDCARSNPDTPLCRNGECIMCTSDTECMADYPLLAACHTEFENDQQVIGLCVQDTYNKGFQVAAIVLGSIGIFGVIVAISLAVVLGSKSE
jgi:hypothetical protein